LFLGGYAVRLALVAPLVGCAVLGALAALDEGAFRAVVREDSVLEWGQVAAYGVAAIVAAGIARRTDGVVRLAYAALAVCALAAIGEELSWGQRLFDIAAPERVAAANHQQELNVHNLVGAESATRMVLLVGALYGAIVPLVLRPGPLVPPRLLVPAFGIAACYFSVRFLFLPRPSYVQAKFSEWPEFCFAVAVALAARNADSQLRESDDSAEIVRSRRRHV
jgi:hypothetical protein